MDLHYPYTSDRRGDPESLGPKIAVIDTSSYDSGHKLRWRSRFSGVSGISSSSVITPDVGDEEHSGVIGFLILYLKLVLLRHLGDQVDSLQ